MNKENTGCSWDVPSIQFTKTRKVKSPARGTEESAGLDFFIPEDFIATRLEIGSSVVVPAGIKVRLPKGYALIAYNKSGIATKRGLDVGACVIDSDYLGEIHIHLTKTSRAINMENEMLKPGDKIIQFILVPIALPKPIEISNEEYDSIGNTERGTGGFGSTN